MAGIDAVHELVGLGDGLIGVLIKSRIFDELAERALAALDFVRHAVQLIYGVIGFAVHFIVIDEFADTAFAVPYVIDDLLHLRQQCVGFIEQGRVLNDLSHRSSAAFNIRNNAVQALHQDFHILQRGLAAAHHILQCRGVGRLENVAVVYLLLGGFLAVNVNE